MVKIFVKAWKWLEMKLIATIRTLNEENNIEKCCRSYAQFCDKVLIADGGSHDKTVEIASSMPKTLVRKFETMVECENGIMRNPDYLHLQFLWDWAIDEGADWIISQDCDQRPNKFLKQDARTFLENTNKDFLLVTQIFLWGKDSYFPDLSKRGRFMMLGLWAWRANIHLKAIDKMPHFEFSFDGENSIDLDKSEQVLRIFPPYCYMHYGWETEEQTNSHVKYYRESGLIKDMLHPLDFGGRVEPLLDWMIE